MNNKSLDENFRNLFKVFNQIIEQDTKNKLNLTSEEPYISSFKLYEKMFNKIENVQIFMDDFDELLENNKDDILDGMLGWIKHSNIEIHFGKNDEKLANKNIKLSLSKVYNKLSNIMKTVEKDGEDYIYLCSLESKFKNSLYSIFKDSTNNEDLKKELDNKINEMRVQKKNNNKKKEKSNSGMDDAFSKAMSNLPQLFEVFKKFTDGMGLPKDGDNGESSSSSMPDLNANMLGNIMKNPKVKTTIQNVMASLNTSDNLGDMMSNLGNVLKETNINELIPEILSDISSGFDKKLPQEETNEDNEGGAIEEGPKGEETIITYSDIDAKGDDEYES